MADMRWLGSVRSCIGAGILLARVAAGATPVQAQTASHVEARWSEATWVDDLGFSAMNSVMSGLLGGVTAMLRSEGSFAGGFARGSLGGAVVYGGKRLSAARFDGAGALGRVVTSLGASLVQDAGPGLRPRRLVIPFGPFRLHHDRDSGDTTVRPDLTAAYWMLYGMFHPSLRLDTGRSLSAGTAVFMTDGSKLEGVNGVMIGGTIFIDSAPRMDIGDVFAHERVHVAQWDHLFVSGGLSVERWFAGKVGMESLLDHVDLGVAPYIPMGVPLLIWGRASNPFEVEADYLHTRTGWQ